ncbi:unnamed protein product, partial [Meganyctiphanes norvegica]
KMYPKSTTKIPWSWYSTLLCLFVLSQEYHVEACNEEIVDALQELKTFLGERLNDFDSRMDRLDSRMDRLDSSMDRVQNSIKVNNKDINRKTLLTFNPTEDKYGAGQEAHLDCGIIGLYESCQWEHSGDIYQLTDVMNGSYSYMKAQSNRTTNQCGITINHLRTNHKGVWTCRVLAFGYNMTASKTLTV